MFLGLPDPDPLARGMDPDPTLDPDTDLLSASKNCKENLDSYCFVTFFGHFIFKVNDENSRIRIRIH
jgi:hypothetical protein